MYQVLRVRIQFGFGFAYDSHQAYVGKFCITLRGDYNMSSRFHNERSGDLKVIGLEPHTCHMKYSLVRSFFYLHVFFHLYQSASFIRTFAHCVKVLLWLSR
jgi:hypothetical protein